MRSASPLKDAPDARRLLISAWDELLARLLLLVQVLLRVFGGADHFVLKQPAIPRIAATAILRRIHDVAVHVQGLGRAADVRGRIQSEKLRSAIPWRRSWHIRHRGAIIEGSNAFVSIHFLEIVSFENCLLRNSEHFGDTLDGVELIQSPLAFQALQHIHDPLDVIYHHVGPELLVAQGIVFWLVALTGELALDFGIYLFLDHLYQVLDFGGSFYHLFLL